MKKYIWLLWLGLFVNSLALIGQTTQYKSGRASKVKKSHIEMLLDSVKGFLDTNQNLAFEKMISALDFSIKNKDKEAELKCYMLLGNINKQMQQYDLAIDYYKKSIISEIDIDSKTRLNVLYEIADAYNLSDSPELSISYYEDALKIAKQLNDDKTLISIKYGLAGCYINLDKNNKALYEYQDILKLEKNLANILGQALVNKKIGELMLNKDDSQQALIYYNRSYEQAQQTDDALMLSNSLRSLGNVYGDNNNLEQELKYRKQSLEINKKANLSEEEIEDNLAIGDVYIQQNNPDEAVEYIQQSINLSEQIRNVEKKSRAFKKLSDAYKQKKEYNKALLAYTNYSGLMDSVHTSKQAKLEKDLKLVASISRNMQRIDMLKKDYMISKRTVELLQKEQDVNSKGLKAQKMIIGALLFVIIAISISGIFVLKSSFQKRKANMLLALKSLRSQMNPHFIFNSLNSVNNFISQKNERLANKYLSDFSSLMRNVMENSKYDFVSLQSELEIIKLYLKLEHQRFSDKFEYSLDIDPLIEQNDFELPPMLIQPYIENAVWHGLRYKETKGQLSVIIEKLGDQIKVIIKDDGIGRQKSKELKTKHQSIGNSTGLKNTFGRLSIINEVYKTNFSVVINDLDEENGIGTAVEIVIPEIKYKFKNLEII